jgi:hypothetical protein
MLERFSYWLLYFGSALVVAFFAAVLTSPRLHASERPYWVPPPSTECSLESTESNTYIPGPDGTVICLPGEKNPATR